MPVASKSAPSRPAQRVRTGREKLTLLRDLSITDDNYRGTIWLQREAEQRARDTKRREQARGGMA